MQFEHDYVSKLEVMEKKLNLLQEQYFKVVKERDRYKKICDNLKKEKFLDYNEEEYNTLK